jgi:hypothetical protein
LTEGTPSELLGKQLPIYSGQGALLHADHDDILLMRLALMEVRAMVWSHARDVSKFRFPTFARAGGPRLRAGTKLLVCEPPNLGSVQ